MEETVEITREEFLELISAFKTAVGFCEELNIYEHNELDDILTRLNLYVKHISKKYEK